ncbi:MULTISPECIES: hypothetical protein [unclassified Methylobacterium]|nr:MULTISPECIES: hypothetical protein [unclassified Methylobacterium]
MSIADFVRHVGPMSIRQVPDDRFIDCLRQILEKAGAILIN